MDTATKSREQKVRRQARRLGQRLKKSRADGTYTLHPLVDDGRTYATWVMTLDQIEKSLTARLKPQVKSEQETELEAAWELHRAAEAAWEAKKEALFDEVMAEAFANPVPMPEVNALFAKVNAALAPASNQPRTIVQVNSDGTTVSHTNPEA